MGTGKSAVGRALAERLGRPFLDLDRKIEKDARRSIPEIFSQGGEAIFRKLEARAVKEAAALRTHVVATGGGVMMDEANVQALKGSGVLVCLTADPDVILKRMQATLASRPLLSGLSPWERIQELLQLRAPFYARADVTFDTTNRSVQEVVEEVMRWIPGKL